MRSPQLLYIPDLCEEGFIDLVTTRTPQWRLQVSLLLLFLYLLARRR